MVALWQLYGNKRDNEKILPSVEPLYTALPHVHTRTVAPTLVPGNDSLAFVLISENDDARGVIQFTSSEINTTEPSQSFVFLARTAGTFGEVRTGTPSLLHFTTQIHSIRFCSILLNTSFSS